ncbi:cell division protein ZapE [Lysobacter sp. KIS68-7]|uniref:cell division protein ZapE n=1 Tax=Lysobacter sp. KIS68-7 TaxID=2904252 RepID=UPI001E604C5E|nr:cell division protein ZapE [Lysobacter sp. KIS68-7]UHQ20460.1 cell division protein ZapE [Lysobacter sp. KIS68-7]
MSESTMPSAAYAAGVARGEWQDDPAQHPALRELDRMHDALSQPVEGRGFFGRLFGNGNATPAAPQGLYLWGGVGRGKTFLIDLFYDGLPITQKRRTHFHRFMREVHERLRAHAGERDPLAAIAKEWRASLRVLVLDEFFVSDIGDAMLLARLLERLFAEGIALVTSSNAAPADLYKDGLQRARFLPAIALVQQHCVVVHLDSPQDYRLRALTQSPVYRAPLDAESDAWLRERWEALSHGCPREEGPFVVDGRTIASRELAEGLAWFDFAALCEGPRGTSDYIELARECHTLLLGGIPHFTPLKDDAARRFVNLVDELYDRHVNLVCTADATPMQLYSGERLLGAFERTASRLIEMQSADYLALEHRA